MTDRDAVPLATEVLNKVEISGMPAHKIRLKIGTPILLTRNLDAPSFVNGTLCLAKTLLPNVIELQVLTDLPAVIPYLFPGSHSSLRLTLTWDSHSGEYLQFPVSVAFGMTINRSQGHTKDRVRVYLPLPAFTHGQLYVAMPRVGSFGGGRVHRKRGVRGGAGRVSRQHVIPVLSIRLRVTHTHRLNTLSLDQWYCRCVCHVCVCRAKEENNQSRLCPLEEYTCCCSSECVLV